MSENVSSVKALVVDDHPLFAQATKNLLEEIDNIEVIGIAGNAKQCMEMLAEHQPYFVFLDYQLPDQSGTEVTRQIQQLYPNIHIIIFTGIDVTDLFNKFIDMKISGILSKESSVRTIKNMVNCILDNHTILPIALFRNISLNNEKVGERAQLTKEEVLMMNMLVKGYTHEQIAEQIHMSRRTIDNYLKKVYDKLGAKSKIEAVEKFVQRK
ncbi:response regulator transcription factor [Paenibacillus sp. SYP-B3998]|uniref:Response regulator transcription factor n=1 Tax=Paenibacillus sp. SYP-B3998 TaxID=2678564 RepID=A0A6G4A401_9BACL|nr:response regulator transcription factor [Paenibacillus sp. SYP-B3998]NEW09115.1 response regulator transcription factor [Paenibacillus sp. SYP-B3998]